MKNPALYLLLCCAVVLELAQASIAPAHTSLALDASATISRIHLDLHKASYGPVRLSVAYGVPHLDGAHHNTYEQALQLTLGSANQTA